MKYCIKCKFYEPIDGAFDQEVLAMCSNPKSNFAHRKSIVTGVVINNKWKNTCVIMRSYGKIKSLIFDKCGEEGRWFEEKKDE